MFKNIMSRSHAKTISGRFGPVVKTATLCAAVLLISGCASTTQFYNPHIADPEAVERQLAIDRGYCLQVAAGAVPIPEVRHYQSGVNQYSIVGASRATDSWGNVSSGTYHANVYQRPSAANAFSAGFASGYSMGAAIRAQRERDEVLKGCMFRLGWTDKAPSMTESYSKHDDTSDNWGDFKEDARAGDADAAYIVGLAYLYGKDIQQDTEQAIYWLQLASGEHHAEASLALHYLYAGLHDPVYAENSLARSYLEKSWREGNNFSAVVLGDAIREGEYGYAKDVDRAIELYGESCDKAVDVGCFRLGIIYGLGVGKTLDLRQAFRYLVKAHQLGHDKAEEYILALGPYTLEQEKETMTQAETFDRMMEIIQYMVDAGYEPSDDYLKNF